jgi:putative transposase
MSQFDYRLYYERHLPHYQPAGATLFITFRLAGSLPIEVIQRLEAEAHQKELEIGCIVDEQAREKAAYHAQKLFFGKWDAELDVRRHGPAWLYEAEVANLVCDALHYRDGKEYTLEAFCVMPNHVHLVCTPLMDGDNVLSLSKMMQSLKGYMARKANKLLGRQGVFWQHESYDHAVRDNEEFKRIVNYVLENPVRAGLTARWVYCRENR